MSRPLADLLRRRIRQSGPMSVAAWMAECLGHPRHGYYVTRDPLGGAGDFTTAPEISQMFGELLGLWAAQCWMQMGRPPAVRLVELGPGRGTLMADALRATAKVPGFHAALDLHLVETSPVLREAQRRALPSWSATWHDRLAEIPRGPLLLLANEFLDALPVRQFQRTERGWAERMVGLDGGDAFVFVLDPRPGDALVPPPLRAAPAGAVVEVCPAGLAVAREVAERLAADGGAALFVDYGHRGPAVGDTLQAVRNHRFAPVLEAPGDADLTAHVDFGSFAGAIRDGGAAAWGPVNQGAFLTTLGIHHRAAALKRLAPPAAARGIDASLNRLLGEAGMGRLFKVLAATPGQAPAPRIRRGVAFAGRNRSVITLGALNEIGSIRHGFFTRQGGVSNGLYSSLNCGYGSGDSALAVTENRRRAMSKLDLPAESLVTVHQVHSPEVAVVERPWVHAEAPRADALVTKAPGVALGVLTADCVPVLFCDPKAEVIGAAHAGWKGAIGGVVESTLAAMIRLGAQPNRIVAAIGPHIGHRSYEVGPEFRSRFLQESEENEFHFVPSRRAGHWLFDLGGYVEVRLAQAGVGYVQRAPHDTVAEDGRFFSYRRSTLRGEPDYGRGLSAIALAE